MNLKCEGFTLIELMISSILSLMVLAGVVKLYHHHQGIYRNQENISSIQENARMLLYMLHTGIQSAGYIGCGRINNLKIHAASKKQLSPENMIGTYKNASVYPGTDALVVRHMNTQSTSLISVPQKGDRQLLLTVEKGVKVGDTIVIADCTQMQVAKVIQQRMNQILIDPPIQYTFSKNSQIGRLIESHFYLADTGRKNRKGNPVISFYWFDISRDRLASEMIKNVEKMSVKYGVLASNGVIYKSDSDIKDWSQVRTVQIILSLTSEDSFLQKAWNTQIILRNLL